jgi:hypothetical protein
MEMKKIVYNTTIKIYIKEPKIGKFVFIGIDHGDGELDNHIGETWLAEALERFPDRGEDFVEAIIRTWEATGAEVKVVYQ